MRCAAEAEAEDEPMLRPPLAWHRRNISSKVTVPAAWAAAFPSEQEEEEEEEEEGSEEEEEEGRLSTHPGSSRPLCRQQVQPNSSW